MRPLLLMLAASTALLITGCSKELTERKVREFIDDADHAFLAGHASDICDMRSDDFQYTGMMFKLAEGRTVSNLSEAMAIENERHDSGNRVSAQRITMNAREFCGMANEARGTYRRMNLVRTRLEISLSPDHKQATARAHYVLKSPEYAYGDSALSLKDQVEQQTGTLQTETDEESLITMNASGALVFTSTQATSKQFRAPKERDARL